MDDKDEFDEEILDGTCIPLDEDDEDFNYVCENNVNDFNQPPNSENKVETESRQHSTLPPEGRGALATKSQNEDAKPKVDSDSTQNAAAGECQAQTEENCEFPDDDMDMILSQIDVKKIERTMLENQKDDQKSKCLVPLSATNLPSDVKPYESKEVLKDLKEVRFETPKKWKGRKTEKKKKMDSETCAYFATQATGALRQQEVSLKRRFAGPAGLLPKELTPQVFSTWTEADRTALFEKIKLQHEMETSKPVVNLNSSKQKTSDIGRLVAISSAKKKTKLNFGKAPWKALTRRLNLSYKDEDCVLNYMNIAWLKSNRGQIRKGTKIPFLAVVVKENAELQTLDSKIKKDGVITINLMDASGVIDGILEPDFMDAFIQLIVPGTALALRNPLFFPFFGRDHLILSKSTVMCLTTFADHKTTGGNEIVGVPDPEKAALKTKATIDNGVQVVEQSTISFDLVMEEVSHFMNNFTTLEEPGQVQREALPERMDPCKPEINDGAKQETRGTPTVANNTADGFDEDDLMLLKAVNDMERKLKGDTFAVPD